MGVQQLEEAWALRAGAREARLLAAPHVPAALSQLGIVRPGDRLVAFADDFADAFARGFDGCDVAMVEESSVAAFAAASDGFDASFDAEGPHLWWFVNSIGGIRCGWVLRCRSRRSIAYAPVMLRASWLPYRSRARSSSAIVWMPRPSARIPCLRAVAWPSLN